MKGEQSIVYPGGNTDMKRAAVTGVEVVMSLRGRRISAASRRSFPLSASG